MSTEEINIRFKEHLTDKQAARAAEHINTMANVSNVRRGKSKLSYYADVPIDKVDDVLSKLPNRKTIYDARRLLDSFEAAVAANVENFDEISESTVKQLKGLSGVFNAWHKHYLKGEVIIAVYVLQSANTTMLRRQVNAIPGMKPLDWEPGALVAL